MGTSQQIEPPAGAYCLEFSMLHIPHKCRHVDTVDCRHIYISVYTLEDSLKCRRLSPFFGGVYASTRLHLLQ